MEKSQSYVNLFRVNDLYIHHPLPGAKNIHQYLLIKVPSEIIYCELPGILQYTYANTYVYLFHLKML